MARQGPLGDPDPGSAQNDNAARIRSSGSILPILRGTALVTSMTLSACSGLPPLMLVGEPGADAPHGPQVAALVAHLKCEMSDAINSTQELPFYSDVPRLIKKNKPYSDIQGDQSRAFTLNNLFKEIEYVGEATWTLDVTQTGAFTPAVIVSEYYNKARGLLPATGAVLSVGGQLSEAAHRYVTFNSSIDFARLNATERAPFEAITPPVAPLSAEQRPSCISGSELGGDLGLKETLATGLIASSMNDISALKILETPAPGATPGGISLGPIPVSSNYSFGAISTQIDFTIIEGVNGGPTWNLSYFKGPAASSNGLLNFNRQVKDTLIVSFVPVCIRQKYWTDSTGSPYEYQPEMIEGTPPWANLLPPCGGVGYLQAKLNAAATAQSRNDLILLQNSFRGM